MNKQYISRLQIKTISLLRSFEKGENKSLNLLVDGACSEVSRLLACWILVEFPNLVTLIAKGENILIGEVDSINEALILLTKKYQGDWKISETITLAGYPETEKEKLKKMIINTVSLNE